MSSPVLLKASLLTVLTLVAGLSVALAIGNIGANSDQIPATESSIQGSDLVLPSAPAAVERFAQAPSSSRPFFDNDDDHDDDDHFEDDDEDHERERKHREFDHDDDDDDD